MDAEALKAMDIETLDRLEKLLYRSKTVAFQACRRGVVCFIERAGRLTVFGEAQTPLEAFRLAEAELIKGDNYGR